MSPGHFLAFFSIKNDPRASFQHHIVIHMVSFQRGPNLMLHRQRTKKKKKKKKDQIKQKERNSVGATLLPLDTNEPRHDKNLFYPYVNNKGADQAAHPRSLISTFVVRYLDSIIPILAKSKISRL